MENKNHYAEVPTPTPGESGDRWKSVKDLKN